MFPIHARSGSGNQIHQPLSLLKPCALYICMLVLSFHLQTNKLLDTSMPPLSTEHLISAKRTPFYFSTSTIFDFLVQNWLSLRFLKKLSWGWDWYWRTKFTAVYQTMETCVCVRVSAYMSLRVHVCVHVCWCVVVLVLTCHWLRVSVRHRECVCACVWEREREREKLCQCVKVMNSKVKMGSSTNVSLETIVKMPGLNANTMAMK